MTDGKLPLTRRKLLGGMSALGITTAGGATSWATSRDTETKRVVVSAAGPKQQLDLKVDNREGVIKVDAGTLHPGERFYDCETLSNAGEKPGEVVYVTIPEDGVRSEEGENFGAETDVEGEGELDDYLYFRAYLAPEGKERVEDAVAFFYGDSDEYVPFEEVVFDREESDYPYGAAVSLPDYDLQPIVDDYVYEFCFELVYRPQDSKAAYGDELYFDVEITLEEARDDEKEDDDEEDEKEEEEEEYDDEEDE
jgi:hypothetical protein